MKEPKSKFDLKNNHKKYPPGDMRRITDIADALAEAGEKHKYDNSPLGIAIRSRDQSILKIKTEIKEYHQTRLSQLLQEIEKEQKEAELLQDIWKGDGRPQYNEGYANAMKRVKSLIQKHIDS